MVPFTDRRPIPQHYRVLLCQGPYVGGRKTEPDSRTGRYLRPSRTAVPVDIYPTEIRWGANLPAGLQHHARVVFVYDQQDSLCAGSSVSIGASFTYRLGYRLHEGAKRLTAITTEISENGQFPGVERHRYTLGYDMTELACPSGMTHAPLRLLTSIHEEATSLEGVKTTLPELTFGYGRRELEPVERMPNLAPVGGGANTLSLSKAGLWPTVGSMLLDFDGDGRLDILTVRSQLDPVRCGMSWSRNKGDGTFEAERLLLLPTIPWSGPTRNDIGMITDNKGYNEAELCSLSHQFSRVVGGVADGSTNSSMRATYYSYRFMDLTGDGRPDLVTEIDANQVHYRPQNDPRLWGSGQLPACADAPPCRDTNGNPTMCLAILPLPPGMTPPIIAPIAPLGTLRPSVPDAFSNSSREPPASQYNRSDTSH